jgi:hypothetical protein
MVSTTWEVGALVATVNVVGLADTPRVVELNAAFVFPTVSVGRDTGA